MGLPFRLLTAAYTFVMMSVALFILTCGILGRKVKGCPDKYRVINRNLQV